MRSRSRWRRRCRTQSSSHDSHVASRYRRAWQSRNVPRLRRPSVPDEPDRLFGCPPSGPAIPVVEMATSAPGAPSPPAPWRWRLLADRSHSFYIGGIDAQHLLLLDSYTRRRRRETPGMRRGPNDRVRDRAAGDRLGDRDRLAAPDQLADDRAADRHVVVAEVARRRSGGRSCAATGSIRRSASSRLPPSP